MNIFEDAGVEHDRVSSPLLGSDVVRPPSDKPRGLVERDLNKVINKVRVVQMRLGRLKVLG